MATLFFSYSHKDEALRDELEVHLAMLKREGLIEAWHDRRILAGDTLDPAIDAKLDSADIILLLISSDFLHSKYCYDIEMQRAMERHARGECRLIAVILRPCDWQKTPFARLLVTPTDGKPVTRWTDRDEAFLDVVRQIRAALPKAPKPPLDIAPPHAAHSPVSAPRSSNLRLKKEFTEADRDYFLDEAFEFLAKFFETSLEELKQRNHDIDTRFKRIDAHSFGAVVYRHGKAIALCGIRLGGRRGFMGGITFSHDESAPANTCNESLNVGASEQTLFLKPMGMTMGHNRATTPQSSGDPPSSPAPISHHPLLLKRAEAGQKLDDQVRAAEDLASQGETITPEFLRTKWKLPGLQRATIVFEAYTEQKQRVTAGAALGDPTDTYEIESSHAVPQTRELQMEEVPVRLGHRSRNRSALLSHPRQMAAHSK
jgi:hypothetical protein